MSKLQILPYNRAVRDLNGSSSDEFLNGLRKSFEVTEDGQRRSEHDGASGACILMGVGMPNVALADVPPPEGTVASLDVSILQDRLLDPILGIKDVRTDKRIDFIGGMRGSKELKRLVDEGKAAVAFSLFPTTMEDLLRSLRCRRNHAAKVNLV